MFIFLIDIIYYILSYIENNFHNDIYKLFLNLIKYL